MKGMVERAAKALAGEMAREEGTPFQPRVNDLDREMARAALLAALDPEDEERQEIARRLREHGPMEMTETESERCVTLVLNVLRSLASTEKE